jgi:hypothetical protein
VLYILPQCVLQDQKYWKPLTTFLTHNAHHLLPNLYSSLEQMKGNFKENFFQVENLVTIIISSWVNKWLIWSLFWKQKADCNCILI